MTRAEMFALFSDWQAKESGGRPLPRDDFNKRAEEVMKRKFAASLSNSCEGGKGWRGVRWKTAQEQQADD